MFPIKTVMGYKRAFLIFSTEQEALDSISAWKEVEGALPLLNHHNGSYCAISIMKDVVTDGVYYANGGIA